MRGCPFHNAAVEASGAMPGVEQIVHLHKRSYVDGLTHLAREAGAADPEMLGNQIALLYEGASGLSTSLNDPAPWAQARATAEALIDQACHDRGSEVIKIEPGQSPDAAGAHAR